MEPVGGGSQGVISTGLSRSLHWHRWLSVLYLGLWVFVGPTLIVLLVGLGVSLDVPGIVHHQLEVLVIVDTHRDVAVILGEFIKCYPGVTVLLVLEVVVHFECL